VRRGLGDRLLAPALVGLAGAARRARRLPLGLETPIQLGLLADTVMQVGFEGLEQALQVFQQGRGRIMGERL
jgi:hypothetical protein